MPIPSLTESDLIGELRNLTGEAQERRLAQAGITGARSEQLRTCLARGLLDQAVVLLERTTWSESRSPDAGGHPVKIDRYEIVELIGTGGMGSVYRAQQRYPIERTVALKLIKAGLDSREALARFDTERQALALMNHPNVARVLDAGTCETGQPYFVMEFVPGQSITSFCDRYNYTIRQRLELFLQACDAVQHAHQKAIIHRDLKSGNILVMLQDDQPVVKVIDFGLAKALGRHLTDRTLCTENGHLMGTPEYVSPEQVEGSADVDTRSDIYSLGVVLYELLAGALPFDPKRLRSLSPAELERTLRETEPPGPSQRLTALGEEAHAIAAHRGRHVDHLARELRTELEWIPLKAMRKDRMRRYVSASQMAEDIRNYITGRALIAGPESNVYRMRKWSVRHRSPLATASLILLLLVGGATFYIQRIRGERARTAAAFDEAQRQQAIADSVSRFQANMLGSADPGRLLGDKVTVVQAIAAAVKELDAGQLAGQPLVEAAVRTTIGNTLWALSRYADAEPNLQRALELRRRALPADHPDIAGALNDLAIVLRDLRRLDEAQVLATEALDIRRRSWHSRPAETALSLNLLAGLQFAQGKPAEAELRFREALELHRKNLRPDDPELALSLNNLALVLQAQERFDEAEPLLRDALRIRREALPRGHWLTAASLHALGGLLYVQGRYEEAEPLFREALDLQRAALPQGHPEIALSLNNLAETLRAMHRFAEAERLHREALDSRRQRLTASDVLLRASLNNLAGVLVAQEKFAEADTLYRESLHGAPTDRHDAEAMRATTGRAFCLRKQRRNAEADALERQLRAMEANAQSATAPTSKPVEAGSSAR